jgi:ribosomal protein L7Ae-like RNA K-turn-binding protein
MKIPDNVNTLLGFARKSGKIYIGETAVENGIKTNKNHLILLAQDLPEKRKSHYIKWFEDKKIRYFIIGTKEDYGLALGMTPRSIIAITDKQMAETIYNYITQLNL